jgi:hypothetical protein
MFQVPFFRIPATIVVITTLVLIGCSDRSPSQEARETGGQSATLTEQAQAAVDQITMAYLRLQSNLASDSVDTLPQHLQTLRDAARTLQQQAEAGNIPSLRENATAILTRARFQADGLKHARDKLVGLSGSVIELVRTHPPSHDSTDQLYVAQCPMVEKGVWLQTSKQITNPYMGSRMLQCGSIQQTIKGPASDANGTRS